MTATAIIPATETARSDIGTTSLFFLTNTRRPTLRNAPTIAAIPPVQLGRQNQTARMDLPFLDLLFAGWKMLAEAGLSENAQSFGPLGVLCAFILVGILVYVLLQRAAEWMIGQTPTTIREVLLYTTIVAALCALLAWMRMFRA